MTRSRTILGPALRQMNGDFQIIDRGYERPQPQSKQNNKKDSQSKSEL